MKEKRKRQAKNAAAALIAAAGMTLAIRQMNSLGAGSFQPLEPGEFRFATRRQKRLEAGEQRAFWYENLATQVDLSQPIEPEGSPSIFDGFGYGV